MYIYELSYLLEYDETSDVKTRMISTQNYFGMIINLGDSFSLKSNRNTLQVMKNHFVILPPQKNTLIQLPANYIYLPIKEDFLNSNLLPLPTRSTLSSQTALLFSMDKKTAKSVFELIKKLAHGYHSKEWLYYSFHKSWVSEIFLNLFSCITDHETSLPVQITPMQKIIVYLEENYTKKTSIDMLASKFYISKYHLMRQFKKETGTTIHNFILNKRIGYACHLIHTGLTPSEACYRSGFTDYSLFFKTFTKMIGTSPSQYREMPHTKTG